MRFLLLLPLLFIGCAQYHRGAITSETGSVVGIDISPYGINGPRIRIGYIRAGSHIIPTSKTKDGQIVGPSFQNHLSIGAGNNAHITEDIATGHATKNLDDK